MPRYKPSKALKMLNGYQKVADQTLEYWNNRAKFLKPYAVRVTAQPAMNAVDAFMADKVTA